MKSKNFDLKTKARQQDESYLVNYWNDGTTSLLTFICTEKQTNIISHQIMQSSIALQIKTQYKTNKIYSTINMEPPKHLSINILQKINS